MTRGLLFNYPRDVIRVVNGHPVTKGDILQAKRERQARALAAKRRDYDPVIKPCFIWVFWTEGVGGFAYRGWWLYARSLACSWKIGLDMPSELALEIMRLFPCGYLPIAINFKPWKEAFAEIYRRKTRKRPDRQGMAIAWAKVSCSGQLQQIASRRDRLRLN